MSADTPKKYRRWPRPLLIVLGVFGVFVLASIGLAVYVVTWDVPPVDDSDLLPSRPALAPTENGYVTIRDAIVVRESELVDLDYVDLFDFAERAVDDDAETRQELAAWVEIRSRSVVEKNGAGLAALEKAIEAPGFDVYESVWDGDDWYRVCREFRILLDLKFASALSRVTSMARSKTFAEG